MNRRGTGSLNLPDWEKAVAAFENGDLSGALFTFRKISKQRPGALVEIGNIYEIGGGGVEQDYSKAKIWYEKAIDEVDDPKAHLGLGRLWYFGWGVEQNFERARYHFETIEEAHEPGALFALGHMHLHGQGVNCDRDVGLQYLKKSISYGHLLALREYGKYEVTEGRVFSGLIIFLKAVLKVMILLVKSPGDKRIRI